MYAGNTHVYVAWLTGDLPGDVDNSHTLPDDGRILSDPKKHVWYGYCIPPQSAEHNNDMAYIDTELIWRVFGAQKGAVIRRILTFRLSRQFYRIIVKRHGKMVSSTGKLI